MGENSLRGWAFAIAITTLVQSVPGQTNPYSFSPKAVESVPDIVLRANSPDLNDRIGVLDQLVTRDTGSDILHFTYVYDLPPEDYLSVARSVLAGELSLVRDRETMGMVLLKIRQVAIDFKLLHLLPEVVKLLEYDDPYAQIFALMVLERLGSEQYIREIVKVASSPNFDVRRPAVEILLKSNAREAVPVLVSCLNDENSGIQMQAIEALGRIGDRSAIPHLLPLLKTRMASWAIRALVQLDAREAVPHIKELYWPGEQNSDIVLTALAYLGDEQAVSQLMNEMVDDEQLRGQGLLDRLVAIDARAVIPALISALEAEKAVGGQATRGPNIVAYMMLTLARLQAKEAIPVVRRYLHLQAGDAPGDVPGFFAGSAMEALGMLKAREVIPELLQILDSEDYSLRNKAQVALARIGEPSTAKHVIASLRRNPSGSNHVQVLQELANISDPNTYQTLSQLDLSDIESLPIEEYLKQLMKKSGVRFVLSDRVPLPSEKKRQGIAGLARSTGLIALTRVVDTLNYSAADYAIFMHDRVVHVVPVEEVYELWDQWLTEHAKNYPASDS